MKMRGSRNYWKKSKKAKNLTYEQRCEILRNNRLGKKSSLKVDLNKFMEGLEDAKGTL